MSFEEYIKEVKAKLFNNSFEICEEKSINYGYQMKVISVGNSLKNSSSINLYYSTKKQNVFSLIINSKHDNPDKVVLDQLFNKTNVPLEPHNTKYETDNSPISLFNSMKIVAGSDESGKGDYFGPLVVCTFAIHTFQSREISDLGVKDSKLLQSASIKRIAQQLFEKYPEQIALKVINPKEYNEQYARVGNLNLLLANTHFENISDLTKKIAIEGAIIDQFAPISSISKVKKDGLNIPLHYTTNAERYKCVAAASIIARFAFENSIDDMSKSYNFIFPKGGGNNAKMAVKSFRRQFGEEELAKVTKLHFKI
ncbi:MAG TPA: ribonuclease HIII [Candidatus Cloacimonadota bacterium]|nr:ribonuclease HIII [Candidatus Cloacimonadota bacterium]HPK40493.1 ribonuclease HIII [Candidatus Cloacimonadota bacterium]